MRSFRSNAITKNIVDNLKNILFLFNNNKQKYFNYTEKAQILK